MLVTRGQVGLTEQEGKQPLSPLYASLVLLVEKAQSTGPADTEPIPCLPLPSLTALSSLEIQGQQVWLSPRGRAPSQTSMSVLTRLLLSTIPWDTFPHHLPSPSQRHTHAILRTHPLHPLTCHLLRHVSHRPHPPLSLLHTHRPSQEQKETSTPHRALPASPSPPTSAHKQSLTSSPLTPATFLPPLSRSPTNHTATTTRTGREQKLTTHTRAHARDPGGITLATAQEGKPSSHLLAPPPREASSHRTLPFLPWVPSLCYLVLVKGSPLLLPLPPPPALPRPPDRRVTVHMPMARSRERMRMLVQSNLPSYTAWQG